MPPDVKRGPAGPPGPARSDPPPRRPDASTVTPGDVEDGGTHLPADLLISETTHDRLRRIEIDEATDLWWYSFGRQVGRAEAEAAMDREWAELAQKVRSLANEPTHAELQRRRGEAS